MLSRLRILRDYFPVAVYTGKALVFISEEWRVELTERSKGGLPSEEAAPTIRLRIFARGPEGDYIPGHYEDFDLPNISELAAEIEKYVQSAVGKNLKEFA